MPILEAGNSRPAPLDRGFILTKKSTGHGSASLRRSAEQGFTSLRRSAEQGFTLIELMIVVTIIALASASVVLAFPDPRGRLRDDAETFAARVRAAHDIAIIEGRSVSVWVSVDGYGFDCRADGAWQPISEKPLRVTRWRPDIHPTIAAAAGRDRVIFDSTGLANAPLDIALSRTGDIVRHVIVAADGSVTING